MCSSHYRICKITIWTMYDVIYNGHQYLLHLFKRDVRSSCFYGERNWVLAINSDVLYLYLCNPTLKTFDMNCVRSKIVWNIWGLHDQVEKLQGLNTFFVDNDSFSSLLCFHGTDQILVLRVLLWNGWASFSKRRVTYDYNP